MLATLCLKRSAFRKLINLTPSQLDYYYFWVEEIPVNGELDKCLTSQCFLSDEQYVFRFCRLSADVLTIIVERLYQALHMNDEASAVPLDISKYVKGIHIPVFFTS